MKTTLFIRLALSAGIIVWGPHRQLFSQTPDRPDLRPQLAAALRVLTDSAARLGLPAAPLVSKAIEGSAKGADDARIMRVVNQLLQSMSNARTALGTSASDAELLACASAFVAGISAQEVAGFRRELPHRNLVQPLVIAADLVRRGVPADVVMSALAQAARARMDDDALAKLRADIARDVDSGMPPRVATIAVFGRALEDRGTTLRLEQLPVRPHDK